MYKIFINNHQLYIPLYIGMGYVVINPTISLELNTAGSMRFTVPYNHPAYGEVIPLSGDIEAYEDDDMLFSGRIIDVTRDFNNQKAVVCEGNLARLNDAILRPYSYTGTVAGYVTYLIGQYNAVSNWPIAVGNITVTDPNDTIVRENNNYPTVWEEVSDKLLKLLGGYVSLRKENGVWYFDYTADSGVNGDQIIRFGVNLIDLDDSLTGEETFTRVVPLGAVVDEDTGERLTIKSVNGGLDYLEDQDAVDSYGVIERVVEWDDVTQAANLKTKAQAVLDDAVTQQQSITLSAVDLYDLGYDEARFRVGNKYMVQSTPHGISARFPLVKATINIQNPSSSVYVFGRTQKTLTGG